GPCPHHLSTVGRVLNGLPRGIAQIEVDGAVMLGKSGVDGQLRAIVEGFAFEHPQRVLYRLRAWGFVLFLIEESCQPAPKSLRLERPGLSVPLHFYRGVGFALG